MYLEVQIDTRADIIPALFFNWFVIEGLQMLFFVIVLLQELFLRDKRPANR